MSDETKAGINLEGMTVEQLAALRDAAETARRKMIETERDAIISRARTELAKLNLTLEEAIKAKAAPPPKAAGNGKVAVKYRGPNGEDWSGRGRLPQWVVDLEAQGKSRNDYLVKS